MPSVQANRRTVLKSAAWTAPAVAVSTAAPAFALSNEPTPPTSDKIAIVGSGYGGAVAALRLAEAGYDVDVYEMGMDWQNSGMSFAAMTAPTDTSAWFQDRTDMPFGRLAGLEEPFPDLINKPVNSRAGVLGIEYFDTMKVYLGKGVGGGSLVNGGMAVTPRRSFFEMVLPSVDSTEMYDTFFKRANEGLNVRPPERDVVLNSQWYEFTRQGVRQGRAAGIDYAWVPNVYDFHHMRREIYAKEPRSALNQEVMFGNNAGKNDLTKTYWAKARRLPQINLITMTEVLSLSQIFDGVYALNLKEIDFRGARVATYTKSYGRVILAAGSVGTTRLLLNAKSIGAIPGLATNNAIGTGWGPNGNTMFARSGAGATGARQSTIPTMGLTTWDDSSSSVFAEIAPLPTGIEMSTSLYLAITNNSQYGSFSYTADGHMRLNWKGSTATDWSSATAAESINAARAFAERLNRANGGQVRTDLFEGDKQFTDYFTYHPLGGVVLDEATDNLGEVIGAPGVFAMDGSLIKGKIGVNPFVTITAMAERNISKLIAAGRF